MSAVSLTAIGQLKGQTAPYSLASITGTVYDSAGTALTIPSPKSLVFFRSKTFTLPVNNIKFNTWRKFNGSYDTGGSVNAQLTTWNYNPNSDSYQVSAYLTLTGGNSSPIYINVNILPVLGHVGVTLGLLPYNASKEYAYGNVGSISVYFPNGLTSGSVYLSNIVSGATVTITTSPTNGDVRTYANY